MRKEWTGFVPVFTQCRRLKACNLLGCGGQHPLYDLAFQKQGRLALCLSFTSAVAAGVFPGGGGGLEASFCHPAVTLAARGAGDRDKMSQHN